MNATASPIDPPPPHHAAQADARACAAEVRQARQLQILQELAEIGMEMARGARDEMRARAERADDEVAVTPRRASPFGTADLGLVYSRVARAVRQTLALETRTAEGIETARVERQKRGVDAQRLILDQRQEDIRDFVGQAIESEAERSDWPEARVERLVDELDERLEDGCYDDTLADAPIAELVSRICFDLGLTPDWRIWDDQDWAIEYLREHTPTDIGAERWPETPPPRHGADPPDGDPDSS